MRILIVDDEIYAVEAIREMIDWQALGIDEVLTAYSMRQAQKLLTEKAVDILLCDIEMPQGSGLELVSWIREKEMKLVTVFLTSHANFNYANQAIRLEIFDYILKPADPEELFGVLQNLFGCLTIDAFFIVQCVGYSGRRKSGHFTNLSNTRFQS